ncbi:hypothetical protein C8T65DRAFT_743047 [Cerioporus squamosus]|nr:hypothetical protein C8T65DRAFT_743047 [Cerioporus squamosus]
MSSDADAAAAAAATVALFDAFYTSNYCKVAASVLFIYDTFITFDREVACFWTAKRPGGASLLFFINKWINMAIFVMVLVSFTSFPSDKVALDGVQGASDVTTFTAPLSAILISHFLLALQESNQMVVRLHPNDPLYSSRDQYDSTPSFISSLGGSINPNPSVQSNADSLELQVCSNPEAPEEQEDVGQTGLPQAVVSSSSTP